MASTANYRNVQDVPRSEWDIGDFALGSKHFYNTPWTLNQQVWLAYLWDAVTRDGLRRDIVAEVLGRNVGSVAGQVRDLESSGLFNDRLSKAMARGVAFFHIIENRIDKAVDFVVGNSESD